jgi:hypothetical protein
MSIADVLLLAGFTVTVLMVAVAALVGADGER